SRRSSSSSDSTDSPQRSAVRRGETGGPMGRSVDRADGFALLGLELVLGAAPGPIRRDRQRLSGHLALLEDLPDRLDRLALAVGEDLRCARQPVEIADGADEL